MIPQHEKMTDRRAAALLLVQEMEKISAATGSSSSVLRLFVDTMANSASLAFGALPERLVVLVDGKVAFLGGKGPEDYSVKECREALAKLPA